MCLPKTNVSLLFHNNVTFNSLLLFCSCVFKEIQISLANNFILFYYTVKPFYNGINKAVFYDRWPLFGASESTYPISWDELRLAFVDRKPLLAGIIMHKFDLHIITVRVVSSHINKIKLYLPLSLMKCVLFIRVDLFFIFE